MNNQILEANLMLRGIDVTNRTLILMGEVDDELLGLFTLGMHVIQPELGPFTILLTTDGGDVESGLAMYDAINQYREHATIAVNGCAHSMGSIILQAANRRTCSANGVIMAHWGYQGVEDTSQDNFKRKLKYNARLDDVCNNILWARMREKNPAITLAEVVKLTAHDWYLSPEEAVSVGLLDEVIGIPVALGTSAPKQRKRRIQKEAE